jgi:hypothetical protein
MSPTPSFPPVRPLRPALIAAALLGGALIAPTSLAAGDVFYNGRATAVSGVVKVGDIRQSVLISDNGMSCQGLPKNETLYGISRPGTPVAVVADEAYTFTQGRDRRALTKARISGLKLDVPNVAIALSAAEGRAEARCDESNTVTVIGKSTVGTLSVNGQSYAVTGQPNQAIEIPGLATITVNEQTKLAREVRVVALRVKLLDPSQPLSGDIQVAAARAKITCE